MCDETGPALYMKSVSVTDVIEMVHLPVVIRAVKGSSSDSKLRHFLHHLPPAGLTEWSFSVLGNDL